MKRRMWILALVLVMVLSALPVSAGATAEDVHTQLYKRTRKSYTASLASYGRSSFHGYCATLVAYQLRHAGITRSLELCNGNEMYDRYKNKEHSSGGYYIHPYSAKSYSLGETLNAISENGTKDVYNILVGFQWTNTSAGRRYGHTVFICGIVDGIVYFTESFRSTDTGPEGAVVRMKISQFADYYNSWTRYEGSIHFTKDYAESLDRWQTDLIVRARFAMQLRSQPSLVGTEKCVLLRTVNAGERLHVTAMLQSRDGQWYYAVSDGDYVGYVVAQAVTVEEFNSENIAVRELQMPQNVAPEETLKLSGTAYSAYGQIRTLETTVFSASGEEVSRTEQIVEKRTFSFEKLQLPQLPAGGYTLTVTATVDCPYIAEDQPVDQAMTVQLLNEAFWVGPMTRTDHIRAVPASAVKTDGWFRENGVWYYYENGRPYTGWLREHGIRYYLDETGAATTGWAEVDGQTCLFSATGALCTGWILDTDGMRYCSNEGRFANGWINIDGGRYYFEKGLMQTEGIVSDGVEVYQLQPDGPAIMLEE